MVSKVGARRERDFASDVDDMGGAVMKSPASGGGTEREQPDHLFSFGDRLIADEFKYSSGDPIYIGKGEIADLEWIARMFGAEAWVVVRWKGDTTYWFIKPEDLHDTGGKNYRVKKENTAERCSFVLEDIAPSEA